MRKPDLPEFPTKGRVFKGGRPVRLGDANVEGRLRLDALMRFAQDFSDDDTTSAGLDNSLSWVVRSVEVICGKPARFAEDLSMRTACSGLGSHWAQRRIEIRGDQGATYDIAVMWVCLDPETHRPKKLSDQFLSLFGESADGRRVKVSKLLQLEHDESLGHPHALRPSDFDIFEHMNNASYGGLIELSCSQVMNAPHIATIEFYSGVPISDSVVISSKPVNEGCSVVFWHEQAPAAAALIQKN